MSNLSGPSEASAKVMNESRKAMEDWMGRSGAVGNPFALHSLAAMTAASAVGLAVASQWTGLMMGLMQGAMGRPMPGFDLSGAGTAAKGAETPARAVAAVEDNEAPARAASRAAIAKLKSDANAAAEAVAEPTGQAAVIAPQAPASVVAPQASGKAVTPKGAAPKPATVKPQQPEPAAAAPAVASPASSPVLEPEDFRRPVEIEKPASPDDLKLIAGVGPKLEQVLNGLGVWTYAQIAAWSPAEVAWVDDYLQFKGRIGRDDWIAQAAALAKGGVEEYQKTFGKEPR